MKKLIGSIFLLIMIMYSSCQNFDENAISRGLVCEEEIIYPKGIIPEWVKDSLSEAGYNLVCQLSKKYEMSYYPISVKQSNRRLSAINEEKSRKAIEWLLDVPIEEDCLLKEDNLMKEDTIKYVFSRLKQFNSESENEDTEICSQTHTIYKKRWGVGLMFVDVSAGYEYHPVQKIATTFKTIKVNTDHYGLTFNIHWQERSSVGRIVNNGKNLELHVDGRLKTSIEIEGLVGSDLVVTSINNTFNFPVEPGHNDDLFKKKECDLLKAN